MRYRDLLHLALSAESTYERLVNTQRVPLPGYVNNTMLGIIDVALVDQWTVHFTTSAAQCLLRKAVRQQIFQPLQGSGEPQTTNDNITAVL